MRKIFNVYLARAATPYSEAYADLDLPATPYELLDTLDKLRLSEGEVPYLQINEYFNFEGLAPLLSGDASLHELNALAQKLTELDERQRISFKGLVQMEVDKKQGLIQVSRLIDLAYSIQHDLFPSGTHAVIFILYKPVGNGRMEKVLKKTDYRLQTFLSLATEQTHPYRIGFDTCFTPALLKETDVLNVCVDACEAATFSMYIDSQMNCYPCSFGIGQTEISASLNNQSLREIWNGEVFQKFRERTKNTCIICDHCQSCQNGCRLGLPIDLCGT